MDQARGVAEVVCPPTGAVCRNCSQHLRSGSWVFVFLYFAVHNLPQVRIVVVAVWNFMELCQQSNLSAL